jgi:ubiquinone/menaquinone biosynthesis C-methylase UbiE
MPAYVLMRAFENAPARYDRAMDLLTLGRIGRLKKDAVSEVTDRGGRVLELGCGAGNLAVMMADGGARVLGIDVSESMLETARERIAAAGLARRVELRRLSVMEIDALPERSFDFVVGTLVLSELSKEERRFVLSASRRLLAPGGRLLIGDETTPPGRIERLCFAILSSPLQLATHLITQAQSLRTAGRARTLLYFGIELPLMLLVFFLVPPSSRPLRDIEDAIREAGLRPKWVRDYLGGTLKLVCAEVT